MQYLKTLKTVWLASDPKSAVDAESARKNGVVELWGS